MSDTDGLGVIADTAGTAPVTTGFSAQPGAQAAQPARQQAARMAPGTGLEWIPKMIPRGVLGQDDASSTALSALGMVTRMVINGGAGTVVGMALAPSHDKRTKYAVIGALLGFFLGPIGIGGQAVYVLSKE